MAALLVGAVAAYGDGRLRREFGEEEQGLAAFGIAQHFSLVSSLEDGPEGAPVRPLLLTLLHVAQELATGCQGGEPDIEVVFFGVVLLQDTSRKEANGANAEAFTTFAVASCLISFETKSHRLNDVSELEFYNWPLKARCWRDEKRSAEASVAK